MANAKPIEQQTIRELRALATTLNLTGWSRMSKERLQAFLRERISALVASPDQVPDAVVLDTTQSESQTQERATKKAAKDKAPVANEITFSNPIANQTVDAINVAPQDSLTFNISVKTSAFVPTVDSNETKEPEPEKAPVAPTPAKKSAKSKKSAKTQAQKTEENTEANVAEPVVATPEVKSETVAEPEKDAKPKKPSRSRAASAKAAKAKGQEDKTATKSSSSQEKDKSASAKSTKRSKSEKTPEPAKDDQAPQKDVTTEADATPKKPRRSSRAKSADAKKTDEPSAEGQQTLLPLETTPSQENAPAEQTDEPKQTDVTATEQTEAPVQKEGAKKPRSSRKAKAKSEANVEEKTTQSEKQEDASVTSAEPTTTTDAQQAPDAEPTADTNEPKAKPKRARKSSGETKSQEEQKPETKSEPEAVVGADKDATTPEPTGDVQPIPTDPTPEEQKSEETAEGESNATDASQTDAPDVQNEQAATADDEEEEKPSAQAIARAQSSPAREALRRSKMLGAPNNLHDRLILSVCDSFWLRADWEITSLLIDRVRSAMGRHWHASDPAIRVYRIDKEDRESVVRRTHYADIIIRGGVDNWYIPVDNPPSSYAVELGYLTRDKQFYTLVSSNVVTTPQQFTREPINRMTTNAQDDRLGLTTSRENWLVQRRHKSGSERFHSLSHRFDYGFNSGARSGFDQERDKFLFNIDAEIVIKGRVEPNARVTVKEEPIKVSHDGEFSVRFKLPERRHVYPVVAIDPKGGEKHTIILAVDRNTKTLETDYLETPIE